MEVVRKGVGKSNGPNGTLPDFGLDAFVGAVLVTAGNLLGPQGSAREAVASGMYYPAAVVVLLGGVFVMAGLPALYLRRRAESGVLGFVAMMAVFAAGMLLTVGFALIQVLIFPWIATMNVSNKIPQ